MATDELIRTEGLVKVYGAREGAQVRALDGIDLSVARGEFVGIVGPSGSGKSTLLQILGCLDRQSEGSYSLAGRDVASLSDRELSRLRSREIGFVFQSFNLLPRLNVLENIALPLAYQGVPRAERARRARELAERVGIGERVRHRPAELSGGQAQRVGLARALAASPRIVFADEPTGNLDTKTAEEILRVLIELHGEGLTIALVTHDHNIARHTDRIVHLVDGRVVRDEDSAVAYADDGHGN